MRGAYFCKYLGEILKRFIVPKHLTNQKNQKLKSTNHQTNDV